MITKGPTNTNMTYLKRITRIEERKINDFVVVNNIAFDWKVELLIIIITDNRLK